MVEAFLDGCFGHIYKVLIDLSVAGFLEPRCSGTKSELSQSDVSLGHEVLVTSQLTSGILFPSWRASSEMSMFKVE